MVNKYIIIEQFLETFKINRTKVIFLYNSGILGYEASHY